MSHHADTQSMKAVVLHSDVPEEAGMDEKDALVQAACCVIRSFGVGI